MAGSMTRKADAADSSPPRRKNDPAGVRARILDAAFDLFQAQGYNATSVHHIAAVAQVTGGALHHHFATKKAIGLAAIGERVASAVEQTWLQPVREAPDARSGILQVFESLAHELDVNGSVRGCPVNNLTLELAFADPEFRSELREIFEGWCETIAVKLCGADRKARATTIVATYSGAMAIAKVEQRGEPLRLCARQIGALL